MKILNNFEQGSLEWAQQRCGKPTMSRAKDLLAGGRGITRQNYILDLVAERLSGEPIDGYNGFDMQRGTFLEDWAIKAFEAATSLNVDRVGFVLHDDERIGCSPDGFASDGAGVEVKCPKPRQHIKNIYAGGIDDYRPQAQGGMWLCERDHWYMVSFCPWVKQYPLYIKRITRNRDVIDAIADSAMRAADEVDALVAKSIDVKATAAISDIAQRAKAAWENTIAMNSEVQL